MRAILYILVFLICTLDISHSYKSTPSEKKQIKVKHLNAKQNHRNKSGSVLNHEGKPSLSFIFSTTSKPVPLTKEVSVNNLSKDEIRKRQKYLRKERLKLRTVLKARRSEHNPSEVPSILSKIRQINMELKKIGLHYGKKRRRTKKPKNLPKPENHANILEITTARNKTYIFKWSLKNDTSLNKIITKLNKDPEQSFSNDSFKTQSDGFSPPAIEKHSDIIPININSSTSNSKDYDNNINLFLPKHELANIIKPDSNTNISKQITFKEELNSNTESPKMFDRISNINYASLMMTPSTTIPPAKNLSLDTIFNEFNAISDQMNDMMPGINKYPKFNMTRKVVSKKNINRCSVRKGGCEHVCRPKGPNKCVCMPGFRLSSNKRNCIDINECMQLNGGCKEICKNVPGSYYCLCPTGLRLSDDKKSCEDINECLLRNGHGPCQDTCTNTYSSYECSCSALTGTRLSDDKHSCIDINECLDKRAGCSHGCVNTLGSAYCTCPDGMMLSEDWKTCTDINECDHEDLGKRCKYGCVNLIGSFRCIETLELQSDQTVIPISDYVACPPLFPPKHGFLECSREKGLEIRVRTRSGRRRVTNRPGTYCRLICPDGYKGTGTYALTCGYNGQWFGEENGGCEKSVS